MQHSWEALGGKETKIDCGVSTPVRILANALSFSLMYCMHIPTG